MNEYVPSLRASKRHKLHWVLARENEENYLICVYPKSNSEISLVISLHYLFTLGALASRFSKSTERPKAKKISLESSFKTQDSYNYSSSDLTKCASKIPALGFCIFD